MPLLRALKTEQFRFSITSLLDKSYSLSSVTLSPETGWLYYIIPDDNVNSWKWQFFPSLELLEKWMKEDTEYFLLRQLVWTGRDWFAYFEKRIGLDQPARSWSWAKSVQELVQIIVKQLSEGMEVKVVSYGDGQWLFYFEKSTTVRKISKSRISTIFNS